jgi:hypothetical protein
MSISASLHATLRQHRDVFRTERVDLNLVKIATVGPDTAATELLRAASLEGGHLDAVVHVHDVIGNGERTQGLSRLSRCGASWLDRIQVHLRDVGARRGRVGCGRRGRELQREFAILGHD